MNQGPTNQGTHRITDEYGNFRARVAEILKENGQLTLREIATRLEAQGQPVDLNTLKKTIKNMPKRMLKKS